MLDSQTKARIDSARDILVGKVPDPKSQVEQITIALIYKFMDDMDLQSEQLGGKSTFFTGTFKKLSWRHIVDKSLSGHDRLALYAEGLEKMSQNENIPQLFRDIFKGAFLPYRDPETLNLFLKEIDGFTYDHSERLGDAFEYLLSVLGSQGDAGQFRTPRHIIDFIVRIVDPQKNETVLDPACGTAGFLISAYKHILKSNTDKKAGDKLTTAEKKRLVDNFVGYDIAPDMTRLSRANMYLHGFKQPNIHEYDTLTSEDRWGERADTILANPPFMTPRGGIRPHNKFSIKAKRSEVLFVDYIAEHLNVNGRAGVIVPEGIIFQSQTAYKQLRKMLVEESLWCVVSLPAGVFNPYSGVKTSILFMDKALANKTKDVLFVKVVADGFDLGAQRRQIETNDFPEAEKLVKEYLQNGKITECPVAFTVSKKKILESSDIGLSGDRYRTSKVQFSGSHSKVRLGDEHFFTIESGGTPSSTVEAYWEGDVLWATLVDLPQDEYISEISNTARKISEQGLAKSSAKLLPAGSVLVSTRATIGRVAVALKPVATNQGFKNIIIKDASAVDPYFVAYMVKPLEAEMLKMASGGTFKELSKTNFSNLEIPLPPLDIQKEIVSELDGYRKIIEGAKQIIDNYKPTIKIDPKWKMVKLGDVCDVRDGTHDSPKYQNSGIPLITSKNLKDGAIDFENVNYISEQDHEKICKRSGVDDGDVLFAMIGTIGNPVVVKTSQDFSIKNVALFKFKDNDKLVNEYLAVILDSKYAEANLHSKSRGGTQKFVSLTDLREFVIPLPSLAIQKQMVSRIQQERSIVYSNKQLIQIYEQKMQDKLAEVWRE